MTDQEDGLKYLADLAAEIGGLYDAVKADMPDASEDEIRAEMVERYVRRHNPALFRVGVTLTPEQEAQLREALAQGKVANAQRLILDMLAEEFQTSDVDDERGDE